MTKVITVALLQAPEEGYGQEKKEEEEEDSHTPQVCSPLGFSDRQKFLELSPPHKRAAAVLGAWR